jgi:hypothetical protein
VIARHLLSWRPAISYQLSVNALANCSLLTAEPNPKSKIQNPKSIDASPKADVCFLAGKSILHSPQVRELSER